MKHTVFIFTIICLLTGVTVFAQPKVGEQAPDITMKDLNGKKIKLSDLKGKVVLVDFWASWCGPCRKAMPALRNTYAAYKARGVEIYGVSLDEDKGDMKKAIVADKISWLQVNEPGGWESATAKAWHIEQLPAAFLLDKQGKVIAVDPTEAQLSSLLKSQLP